MAATPNYMSSKDHLPTMPAAGVMSTVDPSFGGANQAEVVFCSSDGHMGDRAASPETDGLHFRGQRIVRATLADLAKSHGLKVDVHRYRVYTRSSRALL